MLQIVVWTLLLPLLVYAGFALWVRPAKIMRFYGKFLRSQGYKVLEIPYNPIRNHIFFCAKEGMEKGDALKFYKQVGVHYDVVVSNSLNNPLLEFNHPDFLKEYYSVDKHYDYPKQKKAVQIFSGLTGKGLALSEGENWKRKRTILNKIFNFDFVKSQIGKISSICSDVIREKQNQSGRIQNTVTYNILDLTLALFSQVMIKSFLGGVENQFIMGEPAGKFLKQIFADLCLQGQIPINFLLGAKFRSLGITKSQRGVNNRVQQYRKWGLEFIRKRIKQINEKIEKGEEKKEGFNMIEAFLRARKGVQNQKEEAISTEEEIFQEFNIFFSAGTDTAATYTQMMIYSIATHPEVQRKVRQEISTYMKDQDYSFQNLKNLTCIDLLQKETTRYYGPAIYLFQRKAKVDNYLNGLPVKKGTAVSIMPYANHFSEKYFKNPHEFRPERWESECNDIPPFVAGGFSAGARTCIGKHLALIETKIALVKFMKRYKKITLPKQDYKMLFKFLYGPEDFQSTMTINEDYKL